MVSSLLAVQSNSFKGWASLLYYKGLVYYECSEGTCPYIRTYVYR